MKSSAHPTTVVRMSDLGSNIMLRDSIDALFDRLVTEPSRPVVFDFTGVEFLSRSSAHEYLVRKSMLRIPLSESGIGPEVTKMMAMVTRQMARARDGVSRSPAPWSTASPQTV